MHKVLFLIVNYNSSTDTISYIESLYKLENITTTKIIIIERPNNEKGIIFLKIIVLYI